jgi:hypothetical protein
MLDLLPNYQRHQVIDFLRLSQKRSQSSCDLIFTVRTTVQLVVLIGFHVAAAVVICYVVGSFPANGATGCDLMRSYPNDVGSHRCGRAHYCRVTRSALTTLSRTRRRRYGRRILLLPSLRTDSFLLAVAVTLVPFFPVTFSGWRIELLGLYLIPLYSSSSSLASKG